MKLLTASIILLMGILFIPAIFTKGMFIDGLTYATLARNWVEGRGTFWFLHYTNDLLREFHSHPPFGMLGLALGYTTFGDTTYVEIGYSIFTAILVAWGIEKIGKTYHFLLGKISILIWLAIPLVGWAFRSNMLENTMCICTTWAVYFLLKKGEKSVYFAIFSGILLCLGFYTKGPTALFPLCLPILYGVIFQEKKSVIFGKFSLQLLALGLCFLLIMFSSEDATRSTLAYLGNAFHNAQNHTVARRSYILEELLRQIAIPVVLVFIIVLFTFFQKKKAIFQGHNFLKLTVFFILFALTGVFPIMISTKQSGYYMLAAMPFFALGIGAFILPFVEKSILFAEEKIKKFALPAAFLGIIGLAFFSFQNREKWERDQDVFADIKTVTQFVPPHNNIYIHPSEHENWLIYAYYARFGDRSLVPDGRLQADFYLLKKDLQMTRQDFEPLPVSLNYGTLWRRRQVN